MTNNPIASDIVITIKSKGHRSLSLAENFIDAIRPFKLSDREAVALFNQVKLRMCNFNPVSRVTTIRLFKN